MTRSTQSAKAGLAALAFVALLIILAIIGWALNIKHIVEHFNGHAATQLHVIIELVGVFVAPLGVLLGWCH